MTILEMRAQRASIIAQMREILDKAETEERGLNAEEEANYSKANADADALRTRIERAEQLSGMEKELNESANGATVRSMMGGEVKPNDKEQRAAFARFIYSGNAEGLGYDTRSEGSAELRSALGVSLAGGASVLVPTAIETQLVAAITKMNAVRALADVRKAATNVDVPVLGNRVTAYHIAEGADITASTPTFSVKSFKAYKAAALSYLTHETLEDAAINLEAFIVGDFARAFADLEEADFLTGNGTTAPEGILVGGTNFGNSAVAAKVSFDDVIGLMYGVKAGYRQVGTFLMNDASAGELRKLKDTNGQYIWQPSMQQGQPDMLLGKPVAYSDAMPTIATGNKALAFGDFKQLRIIDRNGLFMQRLNEVAATSGQVGFMAYRRYDSKVLIPEAIQYLTIK